MFGVLEYFKDSKKTLHTFEDGLTASKWGIHRSGDLHSFLTTSAVGHLRELQPVCWSESELGCINQAPEEAMLI